MGRFRLTEEDHADNDNNDNNHWNSNWQNPSKKGRNWEFVHDVGDEGALVQYPGDSSHATTTGRSTWRASTMTNHGQPILFVVAPPSHDLNEHNFDDEVQLAQVRSRKRSSVCFLCQVIAMAILSTLSYYIWTYGPPGPPQPKTCESTPMGSNNGEEATTCMAINDQTEELPTWKDYTERHNAALVRSLRAYLVDTTWHVLSWTLPQIASDFRIGVQQLQEIVHDWTNSGSKRKCALFAQHPRPPARSDDKDDDENDKNDLFHLVTTTFPGASAQPHAILPFVQKLEVKLWETTSTTASKKTAPMVFWASQMTPGLAIPELSKRIVDLVLPKCPSTQIPFALLEVPEESPPPSHGQQQHKYTYEEHEAMVWVNRIRRRIDKWTSGGIVVIQHVHRFHSQVLLLLLRAILGLMEDDDEDVKSDAMTLDSYHNYLGKDSHNIVVVLISDKVGRTSMVRNLRLQADGDISQIPRSSLVLDIQHEISKLLGLGSATTVSKLEILPFWFLTREDMEQALDLMVQKLAISLRLLSDRLIVSPELRDEMLSDQRVEIVKWTMGDGGDGGGQALSTSQSNQPKSLFISTNGIVPLLDQIELLENKLRHCIIHANTDLTGTYRLNFESNTRKLLLLNNNINNNMNCVGSNDSSCQPLCSFHF